MTLTIQDLGALGELLGSVAVLVTLVYLALQTRQNTMAIGAQLDGARLNALLSLSIARATSSELLEALEEGLSHPRPPDQARREAFWHGHIILFQWQLFQARRGLLPTVNERGMENSMRGRLRLPGYREWWERNRDNLLPEFVEWVEQDCWKGA